MSRVGDSLEFHLMSGLHRDRVHLGLKLYLLIAELFIVLKYICSQFCCILCFEKNYFFYNLIDILGNKLSIIACAQFCPVETLE